MGTFSGCLQCQFLIVYRFHCIMKRKGLNQLHVHVFQPISNTLYQQVQFCKISIYKKGGT